MSGLLLGLIGGAIAGGSAMMVSLPLFFSQSSSIIPSIDSLKKHKFDFLIGLLMTIVIFMNPHWELFIALVCGFLFISFSQWFLENILLESISVSWDEQKAITHVLMTFLKNIPLGLAAGTALCFSHLEVGYSLLSFVVLLNVLDAMVIVLILRKIELSSFLILSALVACAFIELTAGMVGGYLSKEIAECLPLILSFVSGALMSKEISKILKKAKVIQEKILYNPRLVSGMVVMLIFIIWKELL